MSLQSILQNVAVLEFITGEFEGKTFHQLVVYEYGQKYPAVRVLRVSKELADTAKALLGKKTSLNVSIFEKRSDKGVKLQFNFIGVAA